MKNLFKPFAIHFLAALVLTVSMTGCSGGKKKKAGDDMGDGMATTDYIDGQSLSPLDPDGWTNPDMVANASARPVYFGYDSTQISAGEYSKLQNIVSLLRQDPARRVKVEGHCDERGSREYNLALGERRALAVRSYLMGEGIDSERIQTLSLGEEQPADMGHNESAWRMNRRAEFRFFK
jgi:peptidoglycan-associated lipoprotein